MVGYSVGIDNDRLQIGGITAPPGSPPLPHRLEAESQVSYYIDLNELLHVLAGLEAAGTAAKSVNVRADLGSGTTVTSKAVPAALFWKNSSAPPRP